MNVRTLNLDTNAPTIKLVKAHQSVIHPDFFLDAHGPSDELYRCNQHSGEGVLDGVSICMISPVYQAH